MSFYFKDLTGWGSKNSSSTLLPFSAAYVWPLSSETQRTWSETYCQVELQTLRLSSGTKSIPSSPIIDHCFIIWVTYFSVIGRFYFMPVHESTVVSVIKGWSYWIVMYAVLTQALFLPLECLMFPGLFMHGRIHWPYLLRRYPGSTLRQLADNHEVVLSGAPAWYQTTDRVEKSRVMRIGCFTPHACLTVIKMNSRE